MNIIVLSVNFHTNVLSVNFHMSSIIRRSNIIQRGPTSSEGLWVYGFLVISYGFQNVGGPPDDGTHMEIDREDDDMDMIGIERIILGMLLSW